MESTVLGFYNVRAAPPDVAVGDIGTAVRCRQRTPTQVLSLFSDVTVLKRDSTLFDRVQDLAHIGGWEWDTGRDRVHLTNEAQRMFGQTQASLTMAQMQECLREPDRRRFHEALQQALEQGGGFELDLQAVATDGHPQWLRLIGEAQADDPTGSRLSGTVQDITGRKQAEETLRVQARTDPLTGLLNRDAVLGELDDRLSRSGDGAGRGAVHRPRPFQGRQRRARPRRRR